MIEFEMAYTQRLANTLLKHQLKKLVWLYVLVSVLLLAMGAMFLMQGNVILGVVWFVLAGIYVPLSVGGSVWASKKNFSQMSFSGEQALLNVVFNEDGIIIMQTMGKSLRSVTQAQYQYFTKIEETASHIFLFVASTQCYVIEKNAIKNGTLANLKEILLQKIPNKYIIQI